MEAELRGEGEAAGLPHHHHRAGGRGSAHSEGRQGYFGTTIEDTGHLGLKAREVHLLPAQLQPCGAVLSEEASLLELDQALMLPGLPQDNTRPLLLVGKDSSATVFPTSAISYLSTAPVYSYFNDKARRTELVSLEMYEGKEQGNATIFSIIENTVVSW